MPLTEDKCPKCGADMYLPPPIGLKFTGFVDGKHNVGGSECNFSRVTTELMQANAELKILNEDVNVLRAANQSMDIGIKKLKAECETRTTERDREYTTIAGLEASAAVLAGVRTGMEKQVECLIDSRQELETERDVLARALAIAEDGFHLPDVVDIDTLSCHMTSNWTDCQCDGECSNCYAPMLYAIAEAEQEESK